MLQYINQLINNFKYYYYLHKVRSSVFDNQNIELLHSLYNNNYLFRKEISNEISIRGKYSELYKINNEYIESSYIYMINNNLFNKLENLKTLKDNNMFNASNLLLEISNTNNTNNNFNINDEDLNKLIDYLDYINPKYIYLNYDYYKYKDYLYKLRDKSKNLNNKMIISPIDPNLRSMYQPINLCGFN